MVRIINPVLVFIQPNGLAGLNDSVHYMHDGKVCPTHVLHHNGH